MEAIEKDVVEEVEETESVDEAYKSKAELHDEITSILGNLKRDELVSAFDSISPKAEEEEDEEIEEAETKKEDTIELDALEGDDDDVEETITTESAKKIVEKLDKKAITAAYDDVKDDDDDDVEENDDDDDWSEQYKNVVSEIAKVIKENVKGATAKKSNIAAKRFATENKKSIAKFHKEVTSTSTKKVVKSSFDPDLSFDTDKVESSNHVDALLEGEQFSEEFRTKATTIFEGAVNTKVKVAVEHLEEQFDEQLGLAVEDVKSELTEQVDKYLNYVVEQWMEDNKLALDRGIRTELSEDFMLGLKSLFEEHYIDVPEAKIDVFDDMAARVEDLEEKLNLEIDKNITLSEKITDYEKNSIVEGVSYGLSEVQSEKLKELVESVECDSTEEFKSKVETLKKSYFPENRTETKEVIPEFSNVSDGMTKYTSLLERTGQ
jgi:hypothetical protein